MALNCFKVSVSSYRMSQLPFWGSRYVCWEDQRGDISCLTDHVKDKVIFPLPFCFIFTPVCCLSVKAWFHLEKRQRVPTTFSHFTAFRGVELVWKC